MPHPRDPSPQDIHALVGLFSQGRHAEAAALARSLTERFPGFGFFWKALGAVLMQTGQTAQALEPLQKAAELMPGDAEAHCNLGAALRAIGRNTDAIACYQRALRINPHFAQAHCNLGNALRDAGQLTEAIVSYRKALAANPDWPEMQVQLAMALVETGQIHPAAQTLQEVLAKAPNHVEALDALAYLLLSNGQHADALPLVVRSLRAQETPQSRQLFVDCMKYVQWQKDDAAMRELLQRAVADAWGRPNDLVRSGMDLARLDAAIASCMQTALQAWPQRLSANHLFADGALSALDADALLLTLLQAAQICDAEVERFLTQARHALLDMASKADVAQPAAQLAFFAALAGQCFINEYVFDQTPQERDRAETLRERVRAALQGSRPVSALELLAVAAYFPLGAYTHAAHFTRCEWPAVVQAVVQQQVIEPGQEAELRQQIPQRTPIDDAVSTAVRSQYEESPYPRWVRLPRVASGLRVSQYLARAFPRSAFVPLHDAEVTEVLIAGCGTGQQPIEVAQRFAGAQVTAIDLSLSSLAYAQRKTREMGLSSIDFAQADILQLGDLQQRFDVIESCGVLHHLADPQQGWRVLLGLLKPGGVMKIGLYSEQARRHIVRMRALIAEMGVAATPDGIRACRQELLALAPTADWGRITKSSDFFSTSTCRDLLFHVQEHRTNLHAIARFLQEQGLTFLGFETDPHVLAAYRHRFPDDPAATDLAHWQEFEDANPDVFFNMYQFWAQRQT
ncbi:MAG: tetratricopeptide repeat protein [Rhodoferax sp.]|nr:tetratricopeptide repeat protein [Rhodoferax sp.]